MKHRNRPPEQDDLLRPRLVDLIDMRHELVKLAALIDWEFFEREWAGFFPSGTCRPATPPRLVAGLMYLQHLHRLSDEAVVARWVENPYYQHFTGETFFQHQPPIHPPSLSRWRDRIGDEGAEWLLTKTIEAGRSSGVVNDDSVLVLEDAVTPEELATLRAEFGAWVEESRAHTDDYGETLDGRARFDLQPGHSAENPALRRVQSPEEVSEVFAATMRNARTVDLCAELIGPGIRFHHGKVNSKLPGSATQVKWHQDFPFEPMTNDDMITCLLFIDDVTLENGPLEVLPGSHKGPIYSHWHNGVFTGAVDDAIIDAQRDRIMKCTGKAGSVCLMHASLLHGSAPNLSDQPRTLYITTYYAEDAIELSPNHLPSTLTHELVRGEASGRVRCTAYEMELPAVPKGTSFFAQQEGSDGAGSGAMM